MEETEIQLMIMEVISQVEDLLKTRKFRENLIRETFKKILQKNLEEKNISSGDFEKALDILNDYKFNPRLDLMSDDATS